MESILFLALIIVLLAIVVFFVEEFSNLSKKIFSIPGTKLLLPLAGAAFIMEAYGEWFHFFLQRYQHVLNGISAALSTLIPVGDINLKLIISKMVVLFLTGFIPMISYVAYEKLRGIVNHWPYQYLIGVVIWIISAVVLSAPQSII